MTESASSSIATRVGAAMWSCVGGGALLGVLVGACYGLVVDSSYAVMGAVVGGLMIGPIAGAVGGAVAGVAVVAASRVRPASTMSDAKRRDMVAAVASMAVAGVSAATWWLWAIGDVEGGRRLGELGILVVGPPLAAYVWGRIWRFRYLADPATAEESPA